MKRFTDGSVGLRRLGRTLLLGLAAAILAGASACGGHNSPVCPNMAISTLVLGQTKFTSSNPDQGGISSASLSGPFNSVAINSSGSLFYITDQTNNRVIGFNSIPSKDGQGADFELGQGGNSSTFDSAVPATTQTGLAGPSKVSIGTDSTGAQNYLVVTDSGNNRVLIWNATLHGNALPGSTYYPPDVVVGQPDFTSGGANQPAAAPTASNLNHPTSAVIANGYLVVVDQNNNRVLIWSSVPTTNGAAADFELGQAATSGTLGNCTGNTGPTAYCFNTNIPGQDQFVVSGTSNTYIIAMNRPTDVSTDGFTYLAVSDTQNNRVLVYAGSIPNSNNPVASAVVGQTAFVQNLSGSGTQHLNNPVGVTYQNGSLYVADTANNRVLLYQINVGVFFTGVAAGYVYGQEDFNHVAFNDSDQNGAPGNQQFGNSYTTPTFNTLHTPTGAFADNGGHVYITDTDNNRVLQFSSSPNVSSASPVNGGVPNNCNGVNPQYGG